MGDLLIHLHAPVGQITGYGVHADNFAAALGALCELIVTAWPAEEEALAAVNRRLAEEGRHRPVATIHLMPPQFFPQPAPEAGLSIGYFVWESDVLPAAWRDACRRVDRVWTASGWGRAVIEAGGVDPGRIDVVPEGFDPALFGPEGPRQPTLAADGRYKFLTIGKWEDRKFTESLLRAFDDEFHGDDDVALVMGCTNPFVEGFNLTERVRGLGLKRPRSLLGMARVGDHAVVGSIYRACDAFVAPSRAEGWGLPILEAMASGLPTITTRYSAMTDYADDGNALLLDYRLAPIPAPLGEEMADELGRWAEPDIGQLRARMRWCVENREAARALGRRAAADAAARWTWRHAAERAVAVIARHLGRPAD